MTDFAAIAERNQTRARHIIEDTNILRIWESLGITANLVGSLRTGLLYDHLDIDFHIYSEPFVLADSFAAMARLAENSRIRRIQYANLLDTDEKCLEWHAWYMDDDQREWQIDMIHILNDSPFAGYFERVADRIREALTPATREAILAIKAGLDPAKRPCSIAIYQAVIRDGVADCEAFRHWAKTHPTDGIIEWMP
ncbi:hypothetical protein GGQ74_002015 [Desulfobaculum xiamenense]|uniref:Phosphoglycerate mutase family protein n=1 Tax=Desulfobaculum xiamenense TaxID=995050 RepID=A0A846QPC8_9BACT|nr:phosphoglycerate mutase family protein [Desulfobaculum xiamenense]NJB68342.1 hypothetical protein [Desulfobaculum xiamenense]